MAKKKITVIAHFKAKQGMEERLQSELLALVKPSRSDEGCINYDLHRAIDDPALFIFYENWQSKEHLDRHSVTSHVQAFRSKAEELLAQPAELITLEMIS
jgi:quinol monooxygenase YgiN